MPPSRINSSRISFCMALLDWCIQLSAADTGVHDASAAAVTTATATAAVLTSSSPYASASQPHGGGASSVSADVSDNSFDEPSSKVEFASLLPRASTSLSAGARAGIGVAIGVVVAVIVMSIVCSIAKCCGSWCFRSSPASPSSTSFFIVRFNAPLSSEHATPASVPPASSFSFSVSSQSQCSSESGRRSHSAPPLKRVVAVHSNDSAEVVESITYAFRQFASVSPATTESSGIKISLSHSQRTVAHEMVPAAPSANPFTTSLRCHSSRHHIPHRHVAARRCFFVFSFSSASSHSRLFTWPSFLSVSWQFASFPYALAKTLCKASRRIPFHYTRQFPSSTNLCVCVCGDQRPSSHSRVYVFVSR